MRGTGSKICISVLGVIAMLGSVAFAAPADAAPVDGQWAQVPQSTSQAAAKDGESSDDVTVWMPEASIREVVLQNLIDQNILPVGSAESAITKADMARLTKLTNVLSQKRIPLYTSTPGTGSINLKGLEYASNVTELELNNEWSYSTDCESDITSDSLGTLDWTVFSKLDTLVLSGSRISNISALLPFVNSSDTLKNLTLSYGHIGDFSGITNPVFRGHVTSSTRENSGLNIRNNKVIPDAVKVGDDRKYNVDVNDYIKLPFGQKLSDIYSLAPAKVGGRHTYYYMTRGGRGNVFFKAGMTTWDQDKVASTNADGNNVVQNADALTVDYSDLESQAKGTDHPNGDTSTIGSNMSMDAVSYTYYMVSQLVSKGTTAQDEDDNNPDSIYLLLPYVDQAQVVVQPQDASGHAIAPEVADQAEQYWEGDQYTVDAPEVNGWTAGQASASGTVGLPDLADIDARHPTQYLYQQKVPMVYTKDGSQPAAGGIIVHYVDDTDAHAPVAADQTMTQQDWDAFAKNPDTLAGYSYLTIGVDSPSVRTVTYHKITDADKQADQIDTWMPNKDLQQLVLANMQECQEDGHAPGDSPITGYIPCSIPGGKLKTVDDITKKNIKYLTGFDYMGFRAQNATCPDPTHSPQGRSCQINLISGNPGVGSVSLEGLQYATGLRQLQLSISNGGPIYTDNGGYLYDYRTDITNDSIKWLSGLTGLQEIDLKGSRVSDLTPILPVLNSPNMVAANLESTDVADYSGITNPKLFSRGKEGRGTTWSYGLWLDDTMDNSKAFSVADPVYVGPDRTYSVDLNDVFKLPNGQKITDYYDIASIYNASDQQSSVGTNSFLEVGYDRNFSNDYLRMRSFTSGQSDATQEEGTMKVTFTGIINQKLNYDFGAGSNYVGSPYRYYLLVKLQPKQSYTQPHFIAIPYVTTPIAAGNVTVHYVDGQGNTVAADQSVSGNVGDSKTVPYVPIDGYVYSNMYVSSGDSAALSLDSDTGAGTVTLGSKPLEVTVVYENANLAKPITVQHRYLDAQGRPQPVPGLEDETLTGAYLETKTVPVTSPDGWLFDEDASRQGLPDGTILYDDNASGAATLIIGIGNVPLTVNLLYKQKPAKPAKPDKPAKPSKPTKPGDSTSGGEHHTGDSSHHDSTIDWGGKIPNRLPAPNHGISSLPKSVSSAVPAIRPLASAAPQLQGNAEQTPSAKAKPRTHKRTSCVAWFQIDDTSVLSDWGASTQAASNGVVLANTCAGQKTAGTVYTPLYKTWLPSFLLGLLIGAIACEVVYYATIRRDRGEREDQQPVLV